MRACRLATRQPRAPPCTLGLAAADLGDSIDSGWSISNWTSAVVAAVEPRSGPRRSMQTTDVAVGGQRLGDHRAADAHADHEHVGLDIAASAVRRAPPARDRLTRPGGLCEDRVCVS